MISEMKLKFLNKPLFYVGQPTIRTLYIVHLPSLVSTLMISPLQKLPTKLKTDKEENGIWSYTTFLRIMIKVVMTST